MTVFQHYPLFGLDGVRFGYVKVDPSNPPDLVRYDDPQTGQRWFCYNDHDACYYEADRVLVVNNKTLVQG